MRNMRVVGVECDNRLNLLIKYTHKMSICTQRKYRCIVCMYFYYAVQRTKLTRVLMGFSIKKRNI